MPKETFYPTQPNHEGPNERLQVDWHRERLETVYLTMVQNLPNGIAAPVKIDLDRSGLNRLIRTLKKARDQTYGADE